MTANLHRRSTLVVVALCVLLTITGGIVVPEAPARGSMTAWATRESTVSLARAHAHNDYEHERPLLDALSQGFTSVEADVWLVNGKLLVAHELEEVQPGRTLKSLYLEPLRRLVRRHGGSVHKDSPYYFALWVDVKSQASSTYRVIHRQLRRFRAMLTTFHRDRVKDGAVTVIISGERAPELMQRQRIRYAGMDGRLEDLGTGAPANFMPVISDNWTEHFTWMGAGPMPEMERRKLQTIVEIAHGNGQRVRFWETPDEPGAESEAVWQELLDARADYVNTDHLSELQEFLVDNDPLPSVPYIYWDDCICWPDPAIPEEDGRAA